MSDPPIRQLHARANPERLPAHVRLIGSLLVVLPLATLVAASCAYSVSLYHLLRSNLAPIVARVATDQLRRQVRIGGVGWSWPPGSVAISNVSISNRSTFAAGHGEAALVADRVQLRYALWRLLFHPNNALQALGDVEVDRPTALIERLSRNQYNFSDLLRKRKKPKSVYEGSIVVRDGTLHYRDYVTGPNPGKPELNTVTNVNGSVDLKSANWIFFNARGRGTENRFASVSISGSVSRTNGAPLRINITGSNVDAAYAAAYFGLPHVRVSGGRADVHLAISRDRPVSSPGTLPDITGSAAFRQIAFRETDKPILRVPVTDGTGTATFTGNSAVFNAAFRIAGQAISAHGNVLDFHHPAIAIAASSSSLDPARVAEAMPLLTLPQGLHLRPVAATAVITGSGASPSFVADIASPGATYLGDRAAAIQAHVLYAAKVLTVQHLSCTLNGTGRVDAQAWIDGRTQRTGIVAGARLANIDVAKLDLPPALSLRKWNAAGIANVALVANNQGHPLQVTANVTIAHPHIAKSQFQEIVGRVGWTQGGDLEIARALVQDTHGAATVSGSVPLGASHGQWDLNVLGSGLDLGAYMHTYTDQDVAGIGFAQGHVDGPMGLPRFVGEIQIYGGRYARYATDVISGQITIDPNEIATSGLDVRRYPTLVQLAGNVTSWRSKDPRFDLAMGLKAGDVADLISLAGQIAPPRPSIGPTKTASKVQKVLTSPTLATLTGSASGTFQVTGPLSALHASGQASIADATIGAYRVDQIAAHVTYGNGVVAVNNGVVRSEGETATARGTWNPRTDRVDAIVAADGLNLAQFHRYIDPYADVTGSLDISGEVTGFLSDPTIDAGVVGRNVVADGQRLALFSAFGRYQSGVVMKTGDPWVFTILPPAISQGAEAYTHAPIQYIINILNMRLPSPQDPDLKPTIDLTASVPAAAPESLTHLIYTLRNSKLGETAAGGRILRSIDRLPRPLSAQLALSTLQLSGPFDALKVHTVATLTGLQIGENAAGQIDADADYAAGPHPTADLAATAEALNLAGAKIDNATASGSYDGRTVQASVRATSANSYFNLTGHAALDGEMSANLDVSNVPLAMLNGLLPPAYKLSGQVADLTVAASGPTRTPNLQAYFTLADPLITSGLSGPETAAVKVSDRIRSGLIAISTQPGGSQIFTVTDLAAFRDGKKIASLSGSAPFRWTDVPVAATADSEGLPAHTELTILDLKADLEIQDLSVLALFAPDSIDVKKTGGSLQASIDIPGALNWEHATGSVTITNGAIGLPNLDTALTSLNGRIVLNQGKASLIGLYPGESFAGRSSKGGDVDFSGGGTLGAAGPADLKLVLQNFSVDESSKQTLLRSAYNSDVRGKINGEVDVTGPWKTPTIATPPHAPILVSGANATIPSATPSTGAARTPPAIDPKFRLAIQVTGKGKNLEVHSALLSAKADGDIQLGGDLVQPTLIAHLNIYSGDLILPPSTRLTFTSPVGSVDLSYPVPSSDPSSPNATGLETYVDLYAQATVNVTQSELSANASVAQTETGEVSTGYSGGATNTYSAPTLLGNSQSGSYVITAHMQGILGDPHRFDIDLSSNPSGLSRQQMLASLAHEGALIGILSGGNTAQDALTEQVTEAFDSLLLPELIQPFETGIETFLGLSDFNVDYEPGEAVNVTLTKQLGRVEVTYLHALGASTANQVSSVIDVPQYRLQVGYDITKRLQAAVSTDNQNNDIVSLQGVFTFW